MTKAGCEKRVKCLQNLRALSRVRVTNALCSCTQPRDTMVLAPWCIVMHVTLCSVKRYTPCTAAQEPKGLSKSIQLHEIMGIKRLCRLPVSPLTPKQYRAQNQISRSPWSKNGALPSASAAAFAYAVSRDSKCLTSAQFANGRPGVCSKQFRRQSWPSQFDRLVLIARDVIFLFAVFIFLLPLAAPPADRPTGTPNETRTCQWAADTA